MKQTDIDGELRRRAAFHLAQTHLRVEYYRIRRSLAYPLPVRGFHVADLPLRGIPSRDYPWSIWLAWALEERIGALGHAATTGDAAAEAAVRRDLEALAAWPFFRQLGKPDLALGHCLRTLCTPWPWLHGDLRQRITDACARAVDDMLPLSDELHGRLTSSADLLAGSEPHHLLHNIPIIGTVGAALAARAIGHPALATLDRRLGILFAALFGARALGIGEAVAYDGYVLDFAVDWLAALPAEARAPFLDHPCLGEYFAQSCLLAAPGDAMAVPEIGDVEPERMPFHLSAQAKLQNLRWDGVRAWHLARCPLARLRSDALVALRAMPAGDERPPPAGAHDVHYAAVLRSGYETGDLAVAMAASSSPMGHIHLDNGSVVVGTGGRWLIADPGYQQYLGTSERSFTVGARSHNAPLINGQAQSCKRVQRPRFDDLGDGLLRMQHDLTACYPASAGVRAASRSVWLLGAGTVALCDRIAVDAWRSLAYHWHGHAEAAWWLADGVAQLHLVDPTASVHISSPNVHLGEAMLDRLPGSRGQLTLSVPVPMAELPADGTACIWWFFSLGGPAAVHVAGATAQVGRWRLNC